MSTHVGKQAPDFKTSAVVNGSIINSFTLSDLRGSYVVLFFYPLDFTFVCPTELHAFQKLLPEFEKRGVQVLACSVDSVYAHLAWLNLPAKEGGIKGVSYPLLSDLNKTIASNYGVLHPDGVALRGLFLIDREGVVRHQLINDLALGRSVDEVLRMVDSLLFHEQHGQVCPANWQQGEEGMEATLEGVKQFLTIVN